MEAILAYIETHPWQTEVLTWFAANPKREFRVVPMPLIAIRSVGEAGWIVGAASHGADAGPASIVVAAGQTSVDCVIRRANAAEQRPLPGIFILDGGVPVPPLPKTNNPGQTEESIGKMIWGFAQMAAEMGVSLHEAPLGFPLSLKRRA